jgi:septal ring factor EnvC (AmiA/AmiB activator)
LFIQGETIGEQLNWLENEIENLEQDIKNVKVELEVLLEDKEIEEMRSLLECSPEQQDTYKSKLLELAEQKRAEADELEAYLESLFKRGE